MLPILALCVILTGCTLLNGGELGETAEEASSESTGPTQTEPSQEPDGEATAEPSAPESSPEEFFVPESEPGELFELLGPEDRIVVQSGDNNLSILTFAGEVAAPTANNANQPVFSPDGSVLAWTTFLPGGNSAGVAFADVADDGSLSDPDVVPTPVISFYSVFAPGSSNRLAVLGNSRRGVGVAVVDRFGGASEVLDEGVPYYFAWNRAGTGFVGHVGQSLRQFDITSGLGVNAFDVLPSFRVPGVVGDGSAVFATTPNIMGSAGMSAIVKVQPDDEGALSRAGADFGGPVRWIGVADDVTRFVEDGQSWSRARSATLESDSRTTLRSTGVSTCLTPEPMRSPPSPPLLRLGSSGPPTTSCWRLWRSTRWATVRIGLAGRCTT